MFWFQICMSVLVFVSVHRWQFCERTVAVFRLMSARWWCRVLATVEGLGARVRMGGDL